jgi:hypothetical protein
MSQATHRLAILGASMLTLLGLVMFSAPAASAEPELRVAGKRYLADEPWTGTTLSQYLLTVPALSLVMHCNKRLYTGTTFFGLVGDVYIFDDLEECTTLVSSKEQPACYIEKFSLKGLAFFFLHSGKTYMLVGPESAGVPLALIEFGEVCALPSPIKLTGSYVVQCTEPSSCETESVTHTMAVASPSLFTGDALKFGPYAATMTGTDKVELAGLAKGQKWSFIE